MGSSVLTVGPRTQDSGERSSAYAAGVSPATVVSHDTQVSLSARAPSRQGPAFASVLATIQGERTRAESGPSRDAERPDSEIRPSLDADRASAASRPYRDAERPVSESRASREGVDVQGGVPVWSDGGVMASASVQTPWLLLALGSGSFTWSDDAADEEVAGAIAMGDMVQTDGPSDAPILSWTDGALPPALSAAGNVEGRESAVVAPMPQQIALFVEPATSWERTWSSGSDRVPGHHAVQEGESPAEAPPGEPAGAAEAWHLSTEATGAKGEARPLRPGDFIDRRVHDPGSGPTVPPALPSERAALGEPALSAAARDGVAAPRPTVGDARDTPVVVSARPGQVPTEDGVGAGLARSVEGRDGSQAGLAEPALPTAAPDRVGPPGPTVVAGERQVQGRREGQSHTIDIGSAIAPIPPAPVVDRMITVAPTVVVSAASAEHAVDQIVTAVRMQWKDGIGEAKLQLRPDALGTVTVALRVEAGAVTAVVRAESAQVQEWVLRNQESLRQQLEASGLHLDELVVSPDDRGQQDRQPDPEQEPRRRRAAGGPSATGTRFEQLL